MPSRPQALEAAMYDAIANLGRNGDTELAHVTPREKMLLEIMGGSGTINPRTGLREYFEGGESRSEADSGTPAAGSDASAPASESGYASLGFDQSLQSEVDAFNQSKNDFGLPSEPTESVPGGVSGISAVNDKGLFDRTLNLIREEMDPATQRGAINAITGLTPGFGLATRAAEAFAQALGRNVGEPINAAFGGNAKAMDMSYPDGPIGGAADRDIVAALNRSVPVAEPLITPANPGDIPAEIQSFLGPGLSDIQQRALISTYGTQGVNSAFRSDPVRRYYARLLQRGLLQDGRPVETPYTLPIEQLYMQNVLGRGAGNYGNSRDILAAIGGYL